MSDNFSIKSSRRDYRVKVVDNFAEQLISGLKEGDVVLIDNNILKLYKNILEPAFVGTKIIVLEPSENLKSYQGIEPILDKLITMGFRKNNRLYAIGGGITQDVTAFIASILFRGVEWIFFPTTLLAQCDSCIGSKTSVNFGKFKNQIGGFYPPSEIIIDMSFIKTLTEQDFKSGMGEMTHYYLVSGEEDFGYLKREYSKAFNDSSVLKNLVLRSLQIKKGYIERDEYDEGPRNVFNYGHTFGHAIESLTNYSVPHGIAVSFGMDIANHISEDKGLVTKEFRDETRKFLKLIWDNISLPYFDIKDYKDALMKDKKALGNTLYCILTRGVGDMFKTPLELDGRTLQLISDCLDEYRKK